MALSKQQVEVLGFLVDAEGTKTTHEVAEQLRRKFRDSMHGYYDRAHAVLSRLEKRELVERLKRGGSVATWYVTSKGRSELAAWKRR